MLEETIETNVTLSVVRYVTIPIIPKEDNGISVFINRMSNKAIEISKDIKLTLKLFASKAKELSCNLLMYLSPKSECKSKCLPLTP